MINGDHNTHVGPSHYEGWSCEGCMMLLPSYSFLIGGYCKSNDEDIKDIMNTPWWCPYIRSAIIERNVEEI